MRSSSNSKLEETKGLTVSRTVVYRDLSVRLYRQPESAIWRIDATKFGGRRASTGKTDLAEAEAYAAEFLRVVSKHRDEDPVRVAQRRVRDGVALTQGDAFDIFREKHLTRKRGSYRNSLATTMAYAEAILGREFPIASWNVAAVEKYVAVRRAGGYAYTRPADGAEVHPARLPRHRTIRAELVQLRTILYAVGNEPGPDGNGTLLGYNPLRTISYPEPLEPRAQWVMDQERTEALRAGLAEIDTSVVPGSLGRAVTVIRGTGRRASSVLGLRRRDVLLDPALVSQRAIQLCTVRGAGRAWPFGALWWDREFEKKNIDGISPMSQRVHAAVIEQLELMEDKRPEAFLWPARRSVDRPLSVSQLCNLLADAEEKARELGYQIEPVPWLKNHGWRREYRSVRANLIDDQLVANVVGWDVKGGDTAAMNASYKRYPAESWYLCAEFLPGRDTRLEHMAMGVHVRVEAPAPPALPGATGENADPHSDPHTPAKALLEAA